MRRDRHLVRGDLRRESAPLGQGSRASLLVDLPRDEMPLLIELVVHLGSQAPMPLDAPVITATFFSVLMILPFQWKTPNFTRLAIEAQTSTWLQAANGSYSGRCKIAWNRRRRTPTLPPPKRGSASASCSRRPSGRA